MESLPKGAPVITGMPAMQETVPQFLHRLATSRFTGYAQYRFAGAQVVLLFSTGRLVSLLVVREGVRLAGLDALQELCARAASEDGLIDVYRLSPDLTMALHGLLHGDALLRGQEIKLMDVRSLTAKLKAQHFDGCIRVYTQTRTTLVFYKDGVGFGFFHDGAEAMETTATESQKIANLPGAKMDVLASRPTHELQTYDLLEVVNLDKVWDTAVRAHQEEHQRVVAQAEEAQRAHLEARLVALEEALKAIAGEVLGGLGKSVMAKELLTHGGHRCLVEPAEVDAILLGVERSAKLVAGPSKVRDLVDRLRVEVLRALSEKATP